MGRGVEREQSYHRAGVPPRVNWDVDTGAHRANSFSCHMFVNLDNKKFCWVDSVQIHDFPLPFAMLFSQGSLWLLKLPAPEQSHFLTYENKNVNLTNKLTRMLALISFKKTDYKMLSQAPRDSRMSQWGLEKKGGVQSFGDKGQMQAERKVSCQAPNQGVLVLFLSGGCEDLDKTAQELRSEEPSFTLHFKSICLNI